VDQHREPGCPLNQRADRGPLQPDDQVSLPVTGDRAVIGLGGPLADHHLGRDMCPGLPFRPGAGNPERTAGAQAGDQITLERAAVFDIEGLVDRLVADPHGFIIKEVGLQPVGDLLRAPGRHPPPVPAMRFVKALPRRRRRPREQLRLAIITWIERTYHRRRRQRRLGRLTPIEYETINQAAHAA
jgi:hypothetical protein